VSNTYVMADDGTTFAFLVDGSAWYGSTYPGQRYDTAAHGDEYWRSYLAEGPGFGNNPTHHALGIFPKFDTDRWGTWFTTWLSVRRGGVYDVFSLDLEASLVQRLMWTVGGFILALLGLVLALIALLTRRLSRELSTPVLRLCEGTEAVIRGDYTHVGPGGGSREFARLIEVFNKMTVGLAERLNLMRSLEKLLSRELAEQVAQHGLVLGGKKVEITNLFTDFACFSTISRSQTPEQVVTMLNDYFSELIPLIKTHGGLPDKYIGDAIVAIFGAPVPLENHAAQALKCAIEMQRRVRAVNERRRAEGKPVLEMRIGLNSGEVIAGAIGTDLKMEYTTIGETTNLANRMEGLCAIGQVLVSDNTWQRVRHLSFPGVKVAEVPRLVAVKGYAEAMPVYPVCIDEVRIEKNPCPTGPDDCYRYDRCP
jgi:adenylate cyclase